MSAAVAAGLVAALGSALALNWGYVAQHQAASTLAALDLRQPFRSLRTLASSRRWVAGFLAGIGGWALYVAALRVAPLSIVQAVAAGGIGVLALLTWGRGEKRPARLELVGVVCALAGLLLLAVSFVGSPVHGGHGAVVPVAVWIGASAALVGAAAAVRALTAAAALGVAAGVLYAAGDVATKAAVGGGGRIAFVAVLLCCHGLAFVALQLGFQRGGVLETAGLCSLFTNALPILAGMALFGETLPAGVLGAVRVVAFVLVVAGGVALARGDQGEAVGPRHTAAAPVTSLP